MVSYRLNFTATLENVKTVQPAGGADNPNFAYYVKFKCENCQEVKDKVCLTANGKLKKLKCKFCWNKGMVNVRGGICFPLSQELSEQGKSSYLVRFDCERYEPLQCMFGKGWKIESVAGTVFNNIDIEEDFIEYDEVGMFPVGVYNFKANFEMILPDAAEKRINLFAALKAKAAEIRAERKLNRFYH